MIPLSRPVFLPQQLKYVEALLQDGHLSGAGPYTLRCEQWLEKSMSTKGKAFLTPSGTTALELAAMAIDIQPMDEVILPSYTYVSTANAFVLRGAVPAFVDLEADTMNIDASKIEAAITPKTKAIVPVHYAGISCDMDMIMDIAKRHNLYVVEDAAQGLVAKYKGKTLGTIGHIGCMSFHETKNATAGGQGGAVMINDEALLDRAKAIYDNGTNRAQFLKGKVSQYSWTDIGSNFLMSEILAALLWAQLETLDDIQQQRHVLFDSYLKALQPLEKAGYITLPGTPEGREHNAHIFYLKLKEPEQRKALMAHMKAQGVITAPHYVPLHVSEAGSRIGRFVGEDVNTSLSGSQLLRLPLYNSMTKEEQYQVVKALMDFWK